MPQWLRARGRMNSTGWRAEGFMSLGLVERVAMAICRVRHGPLENGSWAKLEKRDKDKLRMEAVAAIEECKIDPFYDEPPESV